MRNRPIIFGDPALIPPSLALGNGGHAKPDPEFPSAFMTKENLRKDLRKCEFSLYSNLT
jgi:hypothetical protein